MQTGGQASSPNNNMTKEQWENSFAAYHPDAPAYLRSLSNPSCPRCHRKLLGQTVLSRWDTKTEICSDCGIWEKTCQSKNDGQLPPIEDDRDMTKLQLPPARTKAH